MSVVLNCCGKRSFVLHRIMFKLNTENVLTVYTSHHVVLFVLRMRQMLYYVECKQSLSLKAENVNQNIFINLLTFTHKINRRELYHLIQNGSFKGCRMGRSDKVSLWYVSLLINNRFRFCYIKTKNFQMTQGGYQVIMILPIKSKMAAAKKQCFLRFLYFTESSPPSFKVRGLQMTMNLALG